MTHPALADDRLPELARNRQSDRVWPNSLPGDYRFGRSAAKPARATTGRSARGVRRFFSAMLRIIAEAKLRRLARELSIRGVRYRSGWRAIDLSPIKTVRLPNNVSKSP
jgi:hypothetical protein